MDSADNDVGSSSQALCVASPLTIVSGTASSQESAAFPANLAFDGNPSTRWSSAFYDPQWLQIDLGAVRYISEIRLSWETASASDYDVFLSSNGTDWTKAATVHTSALGVRTDSLLGLSARIGRYVKVVGNLRSTPYGYSLYEIAVNGSTDPSCASTAGRNIGANLEAESNDGAFGVQLETTTDTGGGQNAGWIDSGDYLEWQINVPTAGNYTLASRSATWGTAALQVVIDGVQKSALTLPATWTSGANQYQTWGTFTTPAFALTAGTHTLRVAFTSANQNLNWVKLGPASAALSKVEMRASAVDDYLYLSIDGVRRRVAAWGGGNPQSDEWRDITALFHGGSNALRVQAANSGGPGALNVDFRVDGNIVANVACPSATCVVPEDQAPFVDQAVTLPSLNLPAAQAVTITSQTAGKIYIGDEYTGKTSPFTFQLPQGTFKVGLGVSNDTVNAYTGKYLEKTVTVGTAAQTVDMQSSGAGVGVAKPVKIGLLPVRTVVRSDLPAPGYLQDADIDKVLSQLRATNDKLLVPFSYGLARWDITRLPTVTDVQPQLDGTCAILELPQYASLLTPYDTVIILHSERSQSGVRFFGGAGGYSTGQCVSIPNTSDDSLGPNDPQQLFLHEVLHQYEANQQGYHQLFVGAEGLHGAEEHGFPQATAAEGWNEWYRAFIRGQAGETASMRPGITLQTPPTNPNYWVGTFSSIKYGMRSPAPR